MYDDRFETVHSDVNSQPLLWDELLATSTFKSDYSNSDVPSLDNECLNEEDLRERVKEEKNRTEKSGSTKYGIEYIINNDNVSSFEKFEEPFLQREPSEKYFDHPRRSSRRRRSPSHLTYDQKGRSVYNMMALRMASKVDPNDSFYKYLMFLMTDGNSGCLEGLPVDVLYRGLAQINGFKSNIYGPDTPDYSQAMKGPNSQEFREEMGAEVAELEAHSTWQEVKRSEIPSGINVLPSTWAFKVKRYPDGRLRKFKERFVSRGDYQVQ